MEQPLQRNVMPSESTFKPLKRYLLEDVLNRSKKNMLNCRLLKLQNNQKISIKFPCIFSPKCNLKHCGMHAKNPEIEKMLTKSS